MTAMYQSSFIKKFVLAVNIRYLMDKPIVLRLLEDVKEFLFANVVTALVDEPCERKSSTAATRRREKK